MKIYKTLISIVGFIALTTTTSMASDSKKAAIKLKTTEGFIQYINGKYYISEFPSLLSAQRRVVWNTDVKEQLLCAVNLDAGCPRVRVYYQSSTRTRGETTYHGAYVGMDKAALKNKISFYSERF